MNAKATIITVISFACVGIFQVLEMQMSSPSRTVDTVLGHHSSDVFELAERGSGRREIKSQPAPAEDNAFS